MTKRIHGHAKGGEPIDDEAIEALAEEAAPGYDTGQLRDGPRGRGRPRLGEAAKAVGSVRLDPDLRAQTAKRARREGVTVSEIIRRALRQYLRGA